MYDPNYNGILNQGWICSQCGRSFAPHVSECPYCNAERKTFATTQPKTNITPFDDAGWWDSYTKHTSADGQINIGPGGSITWIGTPPEVYLENMSWRDWLDVKTNTWED